MPDRRRRFARICLAGALIALAPGAPARALEEPVRLETPLGAIDGILAPRLAGEARGGVILVPGLGRGARAPGALRALREALPEHGWDVLSLAPHAGERAPSGPAHARYAARVAAAIEAARARLVERGAPAVVVAGHGHGAGAAVLWAAGGERERLAAVISLDPMLPPALRADAPVRERMQATAAAMLDVRGGAAPRAARALVERRAREAHRAARPYRGIEIPVAGPDLDGAGDRVARAVRGWLEHLLEGAPAAAPTESASPAG